MQKIKLEGNIQFMYPLMEIPSIPIRSVKMETSAEEVSGPVSGRVRMVSSETLPSAGLKLSLFSSHAA